MGRYCAACTYLISPDILGLADFSQPFSQGGTCLNHSQRWVWARELNAIPEQTRCIIWEAHPICFSYFSLLLLKHHPTTVTHNWGRQQEDYQKYFWIRSFKICYFKSLLNISSTIQNSINLVLSPPPPWDSIIISLWVSKTMGESSLSVLFCFCTWRDHACKKKPSKLFLGISKGNFHC